MLISQQRSIIPACDVDLKRLEVLVRETAKHPGIGAYKIGFSLALSVGLPKTCELIRRFTDKPIIYDHQKAGTDIPDTGKLFMQVCKKAGVDAVILFPQAGVETERVWIEDAKKEKLGVIVGGLMTHKGYLRSDGGYISDDGAFEIYTNAAKCGVTDFVVPGTKPEYVKRIRELIVKEGVDPTLYSPGLVTQGGDIEKMLEVVGGRWHAIVGRALYAAEDIQRTLDEMSRNIGGEFYERD